MVSYRVLLYPPFPSNCLGCMAPSVIKNKGTPQMSSLEVLKRERNCNLSKWPNFQIRSSVQQMNPIYDSSIPCLNYHCIIVTEINIIVLYCIMIHVFELHEFFHSPKNVLLKALLYSKVGSYEKIDLWTKFH